MEKWKGYKKARIKACNGMFDIELTEFAEDGTFMLEKFENGRWFVCHQHKDGIYYLQENLENGEIIDMGKTDNLPDAIYKIAWAGR